MDAWEVGSHVHMHRVAGHMKGAHMYGSGPHGMADACGGNARISFGGVQPRALGTRSRKR